MTSAGTIAPFSHPAPMRGTIDGAAGSHPATVRPRGLYLITPDDADTPRLLRRVLPALPHATWLQYRNKAVEPNIRRAQALALLPHCRAAGIPLIINDDWRLAAEVGADGAHLGEDDGDLRAARQALDNTAILGASCYDSLELARRAVDAGASYIAFGAFFPTTTKVTTRRATPALLTAAAGLGVPRVAIGGITAANAPSLIEAGADLIAVIGGVFDAHDLGAAALAYQQAFATGTPGSKSVSPQEPE